MSTTEFWNLLVSSTATILSAVAIFLSVILWYRQRIHETYDVFDATYLDILKIAIKNPQFRNPKLTRNYYSSFSDNDRIKYETYAFICWNFCETIFDKGDKELMKTWSVVIDTENKIHRNWFDAEENFDKFKDTFRAYIKSNYPAQ